MNLRCIQIGRPGEFAAALALLLTLTGGSPAPPPTALEGREPVAPAPAVLPTPTSPNRISERVQIRVKENPDWDPRFALFVLPGQQVTLSASVPQGRAQRWEADGRFVAGVLAARARPRTVPRSTFGRVGAGLVWQAPDTTGPVTILLKSADPDSGWVEQARLNIQVMVPAGRVRRGLLNGYVIGRYPVAQPDHDPPYIPPSGFARLSPSQCGVPVSPRFCIDDFACKEACRGGDRYVALNIRLVQFLEAISDRVEQEGFRPVAGTGIGEGTTGRFSPTTGGEPLPAYQPRGPVHVMSGYRTPAYNRRLHTALRSRHQYGDAADIIIDADGDGVMDDLNHDGKVDGDDARTLAGWIEELWEKPEFAAQPGGLGIYNANAEHGPFVHVDVRGKRARWGGNGLQWDESEEEASR